MTRMTENLRRQYRSAICVIQNCLSFTGIHQEMLTAAESEEYPFPLSKQLDSWESVAPSWSRPGLRVLRVFIFLLDVTNF